MLTVYVIKLTQTMLVSTLNSTRAHINFYYLTYEISLGNLEYEMKSKIGSCITITITIILIKLLFAFEHLNFLLKCSNKVYEKL